MAIWIKLAENAIYITDALAREMRGRGSFSKRFFWEF